MEYKDYYAILGVARTADTKAIRSAYRALARTYHPDAHPADPKAAEARFKEVNEAYEVLSDPEKRSRYDQLGAEWEQAQAQAQAQAQTWAGAAGGPGPWTHQGPTHYHSVRAEDLEDLFGTTHPFSEFFEAFFGGSAGGTAREDPRPARPADVVQPIQVQLQEVLRGGSRTVVTAGPAGTRRELEARIPAGVTSGTRLRLAGQGPSGARGRPAADLYLEVEVVPDPRFTRDGDDLHTTAQVPLWTVLLGGDVELATPGGTLVLKIPPETPDGRVFRLRGQGVPHLGTPQQRGDLYVEVHAQIPRNLTPEQRSVIARLAAGQSPDRPGPVQQVGRLLAHVLRRVQDGAGRNGSRPPV